MISFLQIHFRQIFAATVFVALLMAGIALRVNARFADLSDSNVYAFYFHRSQLLIETGNFPAEDTWGFAPEIWPENTPPALGFVSRIGFAVWKIFGGPADFFIFANWFPVFVFVAWALIIYLFTAARFGEAVALVLTFLIVFSYAAIVPTAYGRYFEETIGAPLVSLAMLFFIAVRRFGLIFAAGTVILASLALAWQVFPIVFALLFFTALIGVLLRSPVATTRLLLLMLSFALAEGIARLAAWNAYTPSMMVRELWIGFMERGSPDLLLAAYRRDWRNTGLDGFLRYFGYAGIFLGFLGAVGAILERKRGISHVALLAGGMGVVLTILFEKMRHLSLGLFMPLWVIGAQLVFEPVAKLPTFRMPRKMLTVVAIVASLFMVAGVMTWRWYSHVPEPRGIVWVETESLDKDRTRVHIWLENNGGPTSINPVAFAGLHIEVKDARIAETEILEAPPGSILGAKSYSRWGRVSFFETKFPRLESGSRAGVRMIIERQERPPSLYVRGWLPKFYCSLQDMREGAQALLPSWRTFLNGWRNERCIVRLPGNDESASVICPVEVFAAYGEPQKFRCYERAAVEN